MYDLILAERGAGRTVSLLYGEEGELSRRVSVAGIPARKISGLERDIGFIREVRAYAELRRLLRKERPEIIHINSSKAGVLGTLAARAAGVPRIIFTAHGWAFNEKRPWWQKPLLALMYGFSVLLSTTTICVTAALARDMRWMPFGKRKLVVIANGTDRPNFKERKDARQMLLPTAKETFWIGMLAELHPTKRIEDAIDAFEIVSRVYPETLLVVLGEGSHRPFLEAYIAARKLSGRVHLCGFVQNGAEYLPAFNLFLLPSRTEALSYALIEAGHASLPTVASSVGGTPDIILHQQTGLLTPRLRPDDLAAAILSLIKDPQHAATLGDALHKHVETYFSKARMIEETDEVYAR